jgi:hypothetical protein
MRTRWAPISARRVDEVRRSTLRTAGDQLARIERLRDVVVGAHLEADDAVDHGRGRRQHDDRDARVALAQVARQAQAVLAGHVDVDQREVDRLLRRQLARAARRLGSEDRVAVAREVFLEHFAHVRLVVDDQQRGFRLRGHGFHTSRLARLPHSAIHRRSKDKAARRRFKGGAGRPDTDETKVVSAVGR